MQRPISPRRISANVQTPRPRSTLVGLALLAAADLGERPRQVAVPLQGVHGQVEMAVDEEHDNFN